MKREANFQTTFNHWVKEVYKKTAVFELKQTTGNSIPFSAVQYHQSRALIAAKEGVLSYKIPDCGYQNPFDSFCLAGVPAFVVVKFPGFFCLIDIGVWLREDFQSKRRSLTAHRAKELSTVTVLT